MKHWILYFAVLLIFASGVQPSLGQETEPEEPEIVLPSVILEIEDLSVEKVRAGLPESEELPTPWREHPLPEPGELEIEETSLGIVMPDEGSSPPTGKKDFVAEATVGAGIPNHFFSSISLHKYGELPEGTLLFRHEMLDGFSDKPPGSGYNFREDTLKGMLRFALGEFEIKTKAEFSDFERGLQGYGNFYSKLNRSLKGAVTANYSISERLLLKGNIDGWVSSQLLTGTPSGSQTREIVLSPQIRGELLMENWYLGLTPRLSYRNVPDRTHLLVTRVGVAGDFGVNLGEKYRLDGGVGWFYSEPTNHLVPFHLAITATPFFPRYRFNIDLEAAEQQGKYGGGLLSSLLVGEHDTVQAPVIDLYGFYRPIDFVKLSLEVSDLLLPIIGASRYSWYPYIEQGFGIIMKAQINF